MKEVVIGIFGAWIDSDNMGCVALSYSLISLIDRILEDIGRKYRLLIFENTSSCEGLKTAKQVLSLKGKNIAIVKEGYFKSIPSAIKHFSVNYKVIRQIKECDLVIDITGGDSFTDNYGQSRFNQLTNLKRIVEKSKIPLILGPQTYGPYKKKNIKKVESVLKDAVLVVSRDQKSCDYVEKICNRRVNVTTDLAFSLPVRKINKLSCDKIKVGINVSGLLISEKKEDTVLENKLNTDYDCYIEELLKYLLQNKLYDVYIIPHVGKDGVDFVKEKFGQTKQIHYVTEFDNPISAKEFIADMDIFVGARMHATIAAFSTFVATIPTAYSRKFSGLFESVQYPYTIDLMELDTEKALSKTKDAIENYLLLKDAVVVGMKIVEKRNEETYELFREAFVNILNV